MRPKKYRVQLSAEEQRTLRAMLRRGRHSSRVLNRARVLLMAHEGKWDKEVAAAVGVTVTTVANIRRWMSGPISCGPTPGPAFR